MLRKFPQLPRMSDGFASSLLTYNIQRACLIRAKSADASITSQKIAKRSGPFSFVPLLLFSAPFWDNQRLSDCNKPAWTGLKEEWYPLLCSGGSYYLCYASPGNRNLLDSCGFGWFIKSEECLEGWKSVTCKMPSDWDGLDL